MGTAAAGIMGGGMGLYQSISGMIQARDAKNALQNYERQELNNIAENLQVSTLGADLRREEQARGMATQVDALAGGGQRALVGGLGRVDANNVMVNREIGANLDEQQRQIDRMMAEDNARIRSMQEAREVQDINALSSQYQSGRQDMFTGMGNVVQATGMVANNISTPEGKEGRQAFRDAKTLNTLGDTTRKEFMANYRNNARQYSGGGGEVSTPNTQYSSSAQTPNYTSGFNFNTGNQVPASGGVLRSPRMGGIGVPMYDQFGNEII